MIQEHINNYMTQFTTMDIIGIGFLIVIFGIAYYIDTKDKKDSND